MAKNIFFCFMIAILLALGSWQMFRWHQKEELISKIKEQENLHPLTINKIEDVKPLKYRKIILKGQFLNHKPIYYYSLRKNIPGYEIITPFKLSHSGYILVNRGWNKEKSKVAHSEKNLIIAGHTVELPRKYILTYKNNLENNTWYDLHHQSIAKYANIDLDPLMFILHTDRHLLGHKIEFGSKNIINNHLGYAITWFALAIILTIFYITGKTQKSQKSNAQKQI